MGTGVSSGGVMWNRTPLPGRIVALVMILPLEC